LDYDDRLDDNIIDDIQVLGLKLKVNSFVFTTVAAEVPRDLSGASENERLKRLIEDFGDYSGNVSIEDVTDANFHIAICKILLAAFTHSFAGRQDGKFSSEFRIVYKDSTKMITVGGYFCEAKIAKSIGTLLEKRLGFLFLKSGEPFWIKDFNLSERERHLIELACTARRKVTPNLQRRRKTKEENTLKRLGFPQSQIDAYKNILRYVPRYFESIL
jgi:hypothetical protein